MADFYSDFVNWTTASVIGGALILSATDLSTKDDSEIEEPVLLAAAADSTADSLMISAVLNDSVADQAPPEAETAAVRTRAKLPQIQQAKLETVVFTTAGDSSGLPKIQQPAPQDLLDKGRVTGQSVNLRKGPGTRFPVVGRATQNDRLPVTGKTDGIWVQVVIEGNADAWIHGNYFSTPEQLAAN
ncbi:SH3 domain-containing protein [Halovulum sp. GXIMD14794]